MLLTIENLKKINFEKIAVFENDYLIDIIHKDVKSDYYPYTVIGSDNIYSEKEVLEFYDGIVSIYNAELIYKPIYIK